MQILVKSQKIIPKLIFRLLHSFEDFTKCGKKCSKICEPIFTFFIKRAVHFYESNVFKRSNSVH